MSNESRRLGQCYGVTTVSCRGQVVIPAEARRELGIEPGTKLLVFRSGGMGGRGLMLMTTNTATDYIRESISRLSEFERTVLEIAETEEG